MKIDPGVNLPWGSKYHMTPVQKKIHKQKILSNIRTGLLGSIAGPCDFLPALSDGPTNFKKSGIDFILPIIFYISLLREF
jgi:hypothetical protein